MSRIVIKFGGTSVADIQRIRDAARKVASEYQQDHQIVVVVSAMAGVTNKLIEMANSLEDHLNASEYDVVLSSGEQTTAGLMALALQELGVTARSWLGWQIPIWTDNFHGRAHIPDIPTTSLDRALENREVIVVAGFQGLTNDNRISTLGRGGSDQREPAGL